MLECSTSARLGSSREKELKGDTTTQITKAQGSLFGSSLSAVVRTDTVVNDTNITKQKHGKSS